MLPRDLNDTANARSHPPRLAAAAKRLQRHWVQAKVRRTRLSPVSNAMTSFGMIVGLLIAWAAIVNM